MTGRFCSPCPNPHRCLISNDCMGADPGDGVMGQSGQIAAAHEVARLQAEVDGLKTLLAAQPLEAGEGIFTINMTGTPTAEQFAYLLNLWNEKWEQQGQTPPGLFPLVDGVTLDKLDYDGFGLFVIRVPDNITTEHAFRIARVWDASRAKTETPHV
jgi:hypothetical protein